MQRNKIEDRLIQIGILPNLKGFEYLVTAIDTYQYGMPLMEIYVDTAQKYKTTYSRVERCIRHAKNKTTYGKYTNGEFLSLFKYEINRENEL